MLGHSRAGLLWHRVQVSYCEAEVEFAFFSFSHSADINFLQIVGVVAGFGTLLVLAAPLLIVATPCLLCARFSGCLKNRRTHSPPTTSDEPPPKAAQNDTEETDV